ncbi:MAG: DUF3574 domain-containing protein [Hydrococcus sp. C42_A2020_068]|nr:DUF3574 domain-containing protein [Hydrococcus sp. C42_A2020_068]
MKTRLNRLGILFFISLLLTGAIAPYSKIQETTAVPAVEANSQILIKDELYFGTSLPQGKQITEVQWQQFLNDEITPHFREGLTVLEGYGQYLNSSGTILREKNKMLILLYEPSFEKEQAIRAIIKKYKQQFEQESVLRITSKVRATF